MMLFNYYICLIIIFAILLKTNALESTTVAIATSTASTSQNSSSSESDVLENEEFYVCDKEYDFNKDICHCYWGRVLECRYWGGKLKTANIKIQNETFILKTVKLRLNLTVLEKGKLLPGRENTVEEMDLTLNEKTKIENGVFDKFTNLSSLSMSLISNIDEKILTKNVSTNLTFLSLRYNHFKSLSPNTFQNLHKLTTLNLIGSNISSSLTKELFSKSLGNLKELNLENCDITILNDDVFVNLRSLDRLSLKQNPLTSIPKAISVLPNLNYLNLIWTQITVLTNNSSNKNLKHLDFKYSSTLKIIDDCAFCGFPNLSEVYISESRNLERIHENAFGAFVGKNISKIEKFHAHGCKLTVLPEKLLNWETVKEIRIDDNPFVCNCSMAWLINDFANPKPKYYKNIRGKILTCHGPPKLHGQSFQEISGTVCMDSNTVIDNRITICEGDYSSSTCECYRHQVKCMQTHNPKRIVSLNLKIKLKDYILKIISFYHIPVRALKIGKIVPGREHTVEEIDLVDNQISHIDDKIFDSFISLKTLKLKRQHLQALNNSYLTKKLGSRLTKLILENNGLKTIFPTAFKYFTKLETLSLRWNQDLSNSITKELFSPNLKTLKSLDLSICGISSLTEDIFENLINLEELLLIINPLTSIPTAINVLPNLQKLDLGATHIVHLNNNSIKILPKLKTMRLKGMEHLISVEDCTFCPFPNLKELSLSLSRQLEKIHENAFGAVNGTRKPKLKSFDAVGCNITVFPEKLLNWDTVDEFYIIHNPLICNCSMAWLINDYAYSNPKYFPKMKLHERTWLNQTLKCEGPPELKGKTFKEISNKLCNTSFTQMGIFDRYEEPSTKSSWHLPLIIVLIVIGIFIAGIISVIFYRRKTKSLETVLSAEETEKLNEEVALNDL